MAVTITNSSYAGQFAGKYISPALLSADSLFNGGLEIRPNVKFKEVIKVYDATGLISDGSCDFTDGSTITLTEKILAPKELQVNIEVCKQTFRSDWEAAEMGYSAFDTLPPTFAEFMIADTAGKVAQATETSIWNGVEATDGQFGGIFPKLAADSGFTASTGNIAIAAVTAANVIDKLGAVVDAISSAVYGKEDLRIYVANNVLRAYIRALGGFGAAGLGANGSDNKGTQWYNNGDVSFDGVPVFLAPGMTDNQILAGRKSDLYFGTGLMSDYQEVRTIDMADIDGSQNVRVIMRYTAGTQVGNALDIVATL
tara:strand:- start:11982 stop:12917 length:936 start_codon:yes stop_codon:yes gene_type:complete